MRSIFIAILFVVSLFASDAYAQRVNTQMELPAKVRSWYRNPDGSCVQCSLGMCGVWQNCPQAYTLLWDTEYGQRVRGGSGPSRVQAYSEQRQIPVYNITGEETYAWMRWASKTGRFAAIGAGGNHFQTLYGLDDRGTPDTRDDVWKVCNNNSTNKIDFYSDADFRSLHNRSGHWIVVIDLPPPPACPSYTKWWLK